MTRENRKELIKSIEAKRGSKVITYITSDRPNLTANIASDVVAIMHEHILGLKPEERAKLDLLIYSRGGDSDVPWSIVSMFREYSHEGSFSVLIPFRAHSAATVISLGADEIVMTKKAELGPIDITIASGPYNPREGDSPQRLPISVEDVTGYFTLLEKIGCERPEEIMRGFEQLTNKVHPLALGTVSRLLQQTELVALRLLGTRANPFPEEKNRLIVRRLSSEIYSHRHTISRSEAINHLGLEQVKKAEDSGISDELWELYSEYKKMFCFEDPFSPEEYLIQKGLDEHAWENLNIACIESLIKCDVCTKSVRVRRLPAMPPQINLSLSIQAPPINIDNLPDGVHPQQVQQLVERMLQSMLQSGILGNIADNAARQATLSLAKSLPTANFEHISYNSGWRIEE